MALLYHTFFFTKLKTIEKINNMVAFIFPLELLAKIILYLSVQEIIQIFACRKELKNDLKPYLPLDFSYPYLLTPHQKKAFDEINSLNLNKICIRSVAYTGTSMILINYIHKKIQENPAKRIIVSCLRYKFIKWRGLLKKSFNSIVASTWRDKLSKLSRFRIVLTTIENVIKEGENLNKEFHTIVYTEYPSFFPAEFFFKGINRNLTIERVNREDNWTCHYFIPGLVKKKRDHIIQKTSCLPFQRFPQKMISYPSFLEGVEEMMKVHKKITIIDDSRNLSSSLKKRGYSVFSSAQQKDYLSSERAILVYTEKCLHRVNTRFEGIVLLNLQNSHDTPPYVPSFRCLQTIFLSNNIHDLYYFILHKEHIEEHARSLFDYEVETRFFLLTGSLTMEADVDPFYKYYYNHPYESMKKNEEGFVEWSSISIINEYLREFKGENSKIHLLLHHYEPY